MAIMDTVIPSIRRESSGADKYSQLTISDTVFNATTDHISKTVTNPPHSKAWDEYLDETPSSYPEFKDTIKRMLSFYVREDGRKGLGFILSALK